MQAFALSCDDWDVSADGGKQSEMRLPIAKGLLSVLVALVTLVSFSGSAIANDGFAVPATKDFEVQTIFERLVDIEARHINCRESATAQNSGESLEDRRRILADFSNCVKGKPRYSCNAPLIAVQTAQLYFNEYFGERKAPITYVGMEPWLRKCGRAARAEMFDLSKIDVGGLCKSSYLILPIRHRRYVSGKDPINWSFSSIDPKQECGETAPILFYYYERRCQGIWKIGPDRKGLRSEYESIPLVHDYYDEVDWDVCRVLAMGKIAYSLEYFRSSDGPLLDRSGVPLKPLKPE